MVPMRTTLIMGLLACQLFVAGCAGKSGPDKKTLPTIADQVWILTGGDPEVLTLPLSDKRPITLQIEGEIASGFSGCNQYNAPCTIKGDGITLGPMSLTKRACPDNMQAEEAFIAALSAAAHYRIEAHTLTIVTTDGQSLIFGRDGEAGGG